MGTKILDCLTTSITCRQWARNEGGDGTVIELLEHAREDEVTKVIRPVIGNNQPFGSQRAGKMVAEVQERRLRRWREKVSMEEPLDDR
jgi:hypothetical protein